MNALFATDQNRIAPLLDVTTQFVVVKSNTANALRHITVEIPEVDAWSKARQILATGAELVVCGAVSWPLETMLTVLGMQILANTCGSLDEVIGAVADGTLTENKTEQNYLMSGSSGRRNRCRHRRYRGGRKQ